MPKFNYFWTLSKMAEKSRGRSCSEPFNWAKISCEECHWPISMVRFVKLMVKLALNACQVIRLIHTMTHFVDYYSRSTGPYHILAWDLLDIVASPSGQEVRQVIWWNDISMWPDPVKHAYTLGNISTYYLLLPLWNFSLFFLVPGLKFDKPVLFCYFPLSLVMIKTMWKM